MKPITHKTSKAPSHGSELSMLKVNHFRFPAIILICSLLLQACGMLPRINPQPTAAPPQSAETAEDAQIPHSMVTFNVQLPENTPPGEPIVLNILDEVTGLALNVDRHEMQSQDPLNWSISLPLPVGSTVKYRYSRQGNYQVEEHTSDKRPVRYRMYHVEGPGTVQDVVAVWSDQAFTGPTGRIKGFTTDSENNEPIPNLLISAGGAHTLTAADGSYLLEGLPPGTHNIVAYSLDGAYRTFQQGAVIAPESTTPADIQLTGAPLVTVIFSVSVPGDTMPAVPIRLAGNLYQLGNTFADLSGGISALASRMPQLSALPDGRYAVSLALPVGAYISYKYTLGDGFWNAEHTQNGEFRTRQLIVPDDNTIVEDEVVSWSDSPNGPVLFDLTVPEYTPPRDTISIEFNPYGWTEPIPMWHLGENHWAYVLYSPLNLERFGYRFCRNDQCGSADDLQTMGADTFGKVLEPSQGPQNVQESVSQWVWLEPDSGSAELPEVNIRERDQSFLAGVEFQAGFHPSWSPYTRRAIEEVSSLGANWLVLTPTWTFTRQSPPVLEPVTGQNPLWPDNVAMIADAHQAGLAVALKPTPLFPLNTNEWWSSAQRDFAWWLVWFEHYRTFILHHAALAQETGAEALVLGGDWIEPALPGAILPNGNPSGVPADAASRWRELIEEIRAHYQGELIWALSYPQGMKDPPGFLDDIDRLYLLWSPPLADTSGASEADMHARATEYLDGEVRIFQEDQGKPLILAVAYPSVEGGANGCLPDPTAFVEASCLNYEMLSRPNDDIPALELNLNEQVRAYNALLVAINERDWISGFVSRGFYPPAALQDKSTSIHGKPAETVLQSWYPGFLPDSTP